MKVKLRLTLLAIVPTALILLNLTPYNLTEEKEIVYSAPISSEIRISFVGDINLASNVEVKLKQTNSHYPFEKVQSILSSSNISMGNLETSVAVGGRPQIKQFTFRSSPEYLEGVKWAGIDILSTANNHILDYGTNAFEETIYFLNYYRLLHCGAGMDISEAFKPVIIRKNNKKLAFFASSRVIPSVDWYATEHRAGVAGVYNPQLLLEKVKQSSLTNDLTTVYLHWGTEKAIMPNSDQKALAHLLIDNGADIVVGTHSHTVQGFEFYKGKLISYSLGNFVFTDYKKDSIILNVEILDNGVLKAQVIPCQINEFRPVPLTSSLDKENFYKMLQDRSINVKIKEGSLIQID